MSKCIVVYDGNNQIVTNFYALNDIQKAKRKALNINKYYDIISLDYIKQISAKCNKLCIVGLPNKVQGTTFLFNYLIENGIDIKNITTFHGDCSFSTASKTSIEKEDKYKRIFEKELELSKEEETVNELITMAMESVHNLYWKTGRTANWEQIHDKDTQQYLSIKAELQKKYNIANTHELFKKIKNSVNEFDKSDVQELFKLGYFKNQGFSVNLRAPASSKESKQSVFSYSFSKSNSEYWKLNSDEYYILQLCGAEYTIRNFFKDNIKHLLDIYQVGALEELRIRENSAENISLHNSIIEELKNKDLDIIGLSNNMILSLVKPLYEMSDDIHFNNCDSSFVGLAIRKSQSLTAVLKKINQQVKELGIADCFDSIDIIEAAIKPWSIHKKNIHNPMRIDLKYIGKIETITDEVNGCDKQQVIELFNSLRDK